ncbi:SEC-C metal-binding domain-containing protein, partial [Nocardiopsis rhodophaea]
AAATGTALTQGAEEEAEAAEEPAEAEAAPEDVVVPGFGANRPSHLQYTAPNETGGVEKHTEAASSDKPYAGTGRNAQCPCGSGKKYKKCHGEPKGGAA